MKVAFCLLVLCAVLAILDAAECPCKKVPGNSGDGSGWSSDYDEQPAKQGGTEASFLFHKIKKVEQDGAPSEQGKSNATIGFTPLDFAQETFMKSLDDSLKKFHEGSKCLTVGWDLLKNLSFFNRAKFLDNLERAIKGGYVNILKAIAFQEEVSFFGMPDELILLMVSCYEQPWGKDELWTKISDKLGINWNKELVKLSKSGIDDKLEAIAIGLDIVVWFIYMEYGIEELWEKVPKFIEAQAFKCLEYVLGIKKPDPRNWWLLSPRPKPGTWLGNEGILTLLVNNKCFLVTDDDAYIIYALEQELGSSSRLLGMFNEHRKGRLIQSLISTSKYNLLEQITSSCDKALIASFDHNNWVKAVEMAIDNDSVWLLKSVSQIFNPYHNELCNVVDLAAQKNCPNVLNWLVEEAIKPRCPRYATAYIVDHASNVIVHNLDTCDRIFMFAIEQENFEVLNWLAENVKNDFFTQERLDALKEAGYTVTITPVESIEGKNKK